MTGFRVAGFAFSLVILLVSIFYLFHVNLSFEHAQSEFSVLYKTQTAMLNLDQHRRRELRRIERLIHRYNPAMTDSLTSRIAAEIVAMSRKYDHLDIDFICATITHESAQTWRPTIKSPVGAIGLMQVMPQTGSFLAAQAGLEWHPLILNDPIVNIQLGCQYLNELVKMFGKDGGLAAYNGGPRQARRWLAANRNNNVLFAETQFYIPSIMKLYNQFRAERRL